LKVILVSIMLIIAVIAIYSNVIGGEEGTKEMVRDRGSRVNQAIQSINP
jgi:hypothetical protein